ncbi:MAG TPA: hypothetical protein VF748_13615 [Candidatus Acidoferrum sp.]
MRFDRGIIERDRWMVSLLIITGTMGAGKTSILGEASDILTQRQVVHAAIDVDALGLAHLPSVIREDEAMYSNLRSVCKNYINLGIERFLMARVLESRSELDICRCAISATSTIVCRLTETMEQRVRMRELGMLQRKYVSRVAELNSALDNVQLENFAVVNDDRSLTAVAHEVLFKAGWISD